MNENYLKGKLSCYNGIKFYIIIAQPTSGKTHFKRKFQGRNTIILDIDDVQQVVAERQHCSGWDLIDLITKDMPNLSLEHNVAKINSKSPSYFPEMKQVACTYIYNMLSYTSGPDVEVYLMSHSVNHLYMFYEVIDIIYEKIAATFRPLIDVVFIQRDITDYVNQWTSRQSTSNKRNVEIGELDLQLSHMRWVDEITLTSDSFERYLQKYEKRISYYELANNEWISDSFATLGNLNNEVRFNDFHIDSIVHNYEVKIIMYRAMRDLIEEVDEHDLDKLDCDYNLSTWIQDGFANHKDGTNGQHHHKESWRYISDIMHGAADWVSASYRKSTDGLDPEKCSLSRMSVDLDSLLVNTLKEFKFLSKYYREFVDEFRTLLKGSH